MTDTSDDFLTGGGADLPAVQAENATKTAERADTGSEAARRNRRRRQASIMTRDFAPPQLSTPGLLGA